MEKTFFLAAAEKYKDMIYRIALNYYRNPEDADDTVQDVLIKLYTADRPFQSEEHLRNWLIRVTINECKNVLRTPWRRWTVSWEEIAATTAFPDGRSFDYQIMNCKKGSFTDTLLNIGDADDYTEWSYQTASGETVCLASSPDKCLIFADLKDSFVTVNVLERTAEDSGNVTAESLQELADSFDFSMLNP